MRQTNTAKLEERLAGLSLHLVVAGVPLEALDDHICLTTGNPRVPRQSAGYACLLAEAIAALEDAAIAHGYAPDAVRAWPSIPVPMAVATCELLLRGD